HHRDGGENADDADDHQDLDEREPRLATPHESKIRGGLRVINAAVRQFFVKMGVNPCRVIAAVSGGTDSTALLLALADLREDGFEIEAAHVNHHLRAE